MHWLSNAQLSLIGIISDLWYMIIGIVNDMWYVSEHLSLSWFKDLLNVVARLYDSRDSACL